MGSHATSRVLTLLASGILALQSARKGAGCSGHLVGADTRALGKGHPLAAKNPTLRGAGSTSFREREASVEKGRVLWERGGLRDGRIPCCESRIPSVATGRPYGRILKRIGYCKNQRQSCQRQTQVPRRRKETGMVVGE